jgi:branched-chain amino acid transport system ATP-binding protein
VLDNVRTALLPSAGRSFSLSAAPLAELTKPAMKMLVDLGLDRVANDAADTLSLGDRKRLEFGIVLATKPKILLLDEPPAGMGLNERRSLMELMAETAARDNITLVFVEHDIDIVFRFAERTTAGAGQDLCRGHAGRNRCQPGRAGNLPRHGGVPDA